MGRTTIDGRYNVIRTLGSGSTGVVYLAHPTGQDQVLAVKVMDVPSSALGGAPTLQDEIVLLSHLNHPNIVKIHNFGVTSKGKPYFIMEYVDGPRLDISLLNLIGEQGFYSILVDICLALEHIHAYGFLHRDVKPTNILLQSRGTEVPRAKLSDFGLAVTGVATGEIRLAGTMEYFAPETIRGAFVDRRADLYSLGVSLYEILTGQNPFRADRPREILRQHLETIPSPPSMINRNISKTLDEIVLQLLEKDPLDRFATASAVIEYLRQEAGYSLSKEQREAMCILPPGRFVGRHKELAQLQKWLTKMLAGRSQLVFIEGQYGIGKSRLLQEFAISCQMAGTMVHDEQWWREMLNSSSALVGPGGRTPSDYRFWELICRQISQFSKGLVILIEDLEHQDPDPLPFWEYLLQRLPRHGLMICCSYEPSQLESRQKTLIKNLRNSKLGSQVCLLKLRPIGRSALTELVRSRFKLVRGEAQLVEYLHGVSEGNPLSIEAFVSALRDHGVLTFEEDRWMLDIDRLREVPFPRALRDINDLTLAGISAPVKNLLMVASVVGDSFELQDLQAVLHVSSKAFYSSLGAALRDGILSRESTTAEQGGRYRFAKAGLRNQLYHSLSSHVRRKIHHQIALRMESKAVSERDLVALGDHFHQAGLFSKSATYSARAAKQAQTNARIRDAHRLYTQALQAMKILQRRAGKISVLEGLGDVSELLGQPEEALRYYDQALQLLIRPGSGHRLEIQRKKAVLLRRQSQYDQALSILRRSLRQAGQKVHRRIRSRLLAEIGWVQRMKADYDASLKTLGEALKLLHWGQDRVDTAQILNNLGVVNWTLGHYQNAQAYYERALKIYQELGEQERIAALLDNLGLVYLSQGHINRAVNNFQESLHLRRTTADVLGEAKACHNLAMAFGESGEWEQAIFFYLQSQKIKERIGDREGLTLTLNNLGILHMHRGMWTEAQKCQKEALELRKELNDIYGLCGSYDNLGDLSRVREDWVEARQYYMKAKRLRATIKDQIGACHSLLNLGWLNVDQGQVHQAERWLQSSANCFQENGDRMGLMQVNLARAELYLSLGQAEQARTHAEDALAQASRAGNLFAKAQAARSLALVEALTGSLRASEVLFNRCLVDLKKLQARYELAKAYFLLGFIKQKFMRAREAIRYYREALTIFRKLGVKPFMSRIEKQLENIEMFLDRQESTELVTLYHMSEILNTMRDLDLLLERVLDLAIEILHAERGAIIFYDREENGYQIKVARSMEKQTLSDALDISRSIVRSVAQEGKPVVVDNALLDKQFKRWQSVTMYNIMALLCVPLRIKDQVIGTIYLDNRTTPGIFSTRDVSFLESFANLTALAIENATMYSELHGENVHLKEELKTTYKYDNIVGNSKAMQGIFNLVERVSCSKANVLILGESGTGKELVARLIHYSSPRSEKPFLKVNCAALTESLLESELFGIEERIATGVKSRKGKFELADGGTIFLDEVGDMSLSTQAKVLRVLQEREFERVGGSKTIKVDLRIISATNQDLQGAIEEKKFRKDLFYRLNTVAINIPPLRERKEDIPFLVDYFIQKYCRENQRELVSVSAEAREAFLRYPWPGNVRELENAVQRGVVMAEGKTFPVEFIPVLPDKLEEEHIFNVPASKEKLDDIIGFIERSVIEKAMHEYGGIQLKAAGALGISESALRYKMRKYGLKR